MAGAPFSLEGLFIYFSETFTAGVIQSYKGQELDVAPLLRQEDLLEDFKKFGNENDVIFQEYDPPAEDNSKMGWKASRPASWWHSLWKAMKHAFCIQIVGGVALGSIAILILVLDFNTVDLCFDWQKSNWTALPKRTQAVMVTGACCQAYMVQLWSFLVVLFLFGWPLIKELNLLVLNLFGAFVDTCYRLYLQVYDIYERHWRSFPLNAIFVLMLLMNSLLIGREIARRNENRRPGRMKKTLQVFAMLLAQFAFGIPITFVFVYVLIPLYGRANETNRAVIAGALPLVTAMPKVIVRLAAQRIDFLHPGDSHALLVVLNFASAIVFRVMQAELTNLNFYILLSLAHGAVDLLERLTIVIRDYLWYFVYKKLKQCGVETTLNAARFRTPRSMRFVADVSIQMILGESTSLIAAVGFIQLYKFMYPVPDGSAQSALDQFFIRVSIALSIDFVFNSFSLWLQMSYLNVAVVRVWRKKWRKHMLIGLIITIPALCYFTTHLFAVVEAKNTSKAIINYKKFNCTGPFTKFG